jgi:hypothetical protein
MLSQELAAQTPQIQTWPIERLVEYPRNPRKNDSAVDRMCGSIREFGFKIPCLVRSDGEIVDGHLLFHPAEQRFEKMEGGHLLSTHVVRFLTVGSVVI